MKGNLTRRGKNSWRFKYDVPGNGKRETRYVTLRNVTKTQAQAEASKIAASLVTGLHVDPSTESVAAFVERWLKDWAAANVSNQTYEGYAQMLRKHLCSRVGKMVIQKLRAADLQAVYAAMAADGLADRTRLHLHRIVHVMLKHAMQWGIVPRNVAEMVDAPRVREEEIEILTAGEMQSVLESLRGKPLYAITALALASGLRRGELLALRWQDIDLDGAFLRVERALEETRRGIAFKAPKTRHGRRTVTLPMPTVVVLREHWKVQQEHRLRFGFGKAQADALVFPDWDGAPRSPRALTLAWAKMAKAAGLTGVSFHCLRHTHASVMIAGGVDVLSLSRRLGHGSAAITLGVYGHLFKPDDRAAAIMEKVLG